MYPVSLPQVVVLCFVYSNTCVKRPLQKDHKLVSKTNYRLMQVKNIAEWEHSAILSTFIKQPFVIKLFVLCILSGRFTQILL